MASERDNCIIEKISNRAISVSIKDVKDDLLYDCSPLGLIVIASSTNIYVITGDTCISSFEIKSINPNESLSGIKFSPDGVNLLLVFTTTIEVCRIIAGVITSYYRFNTLVMPNGYIIKPVWYGNGSLLAIRQQESCIFLDIGAVNIMDARLIMELETDFVGDADINVYNVTKDSQPITADDWIATADLTMFSTRTFGKDMSNNNDGITIVGRFIDDTTIHKYILVSTPNGTQYLKQYDDKLNIKMIITLTVDQQLLVARAGALIIRQDNKVRVYVNSVQMTDWMEIHDEIENTPLSNVTTSANYIVVSYHTEDESNVLKFILT
jgi:hypothetical protein